MNEIFERREQWYYTYTEWLKEAARRLEQTGASSTCPCCGYPTLCERGAFDICILCDWEDDGQDDANADEVWGGLNKDYSLSEARRNYRRHDTMFRISDRVAYERHSQRLPAKRRLVEVYERMLKSYGHTQFYIEFVELKIEEAVLISQIRGT